MNSTTPWRGVLCTVFLALASCENQESVAECPRNAQQIEALERLATLETDLTAFAAAQPGVGKAEVFVRQGTALVLLTPTHPGGAIERSVVDTINARIAQEAGLTKEQIAIRLRAGKGEGQ
jgi:hypothetical protein